MLLLVGYTARRLDGRSGDHRWLNRTRRRSTWYRHNGPLPVHHRSGSLGCTNCDDPLSDHLLYERNDPILAVHNLLLRLSQFCKAFEIAGSPLRQVHTAIQARAVGPGGRTLSAILSISDRRWVSSVSNCGTVGVHTFRWSIQATRVALSRVADSALFQLRLIFRANPNIGVPLT